MNSQNEDLDGDAEAMDELDQLAGSKVDGSIVLALRQLVNDGVPVL